jgi:galactose mutarotase-like enzyme
MNMKKVFGTMPNGEICHLYTLRAGKLTAEISDLGATLVRLWVPDAQGNVADVVLGYDSPDGYLESKTYFGATVGRNANRLAGSCFVLNGKTWTLDANEGPNNLHSGPCGYNIRLWDVIPIRKIGSFCTCTAPTVTRASPETRTFLSPICWKTMVFASHTMPYPTRIRCLI